jgi:hypothetical protein
MKHIFFPALVSFSVTSGAYVALGWVTDSSPQGAALRSSLTVLTATVAACAGLVCAAQTADDGEDPQ